ncbi:hypothetical protein llap_5876 [Limosa lapponica baueri]|uniref:Uncharacterized protein n=1 Tax=Limosa lapponica baueri TaxID=1758121 RepID=A0A2I0UCN7_LIMLA|nr:hypothetical protein llap_5876 [Limosa lapponica baueri]
MRSSIDKWQQPHIHEPWSPLGTPANLITVGGTTQQDISNLAGSCDRGANKERYQLDFVLTNKEGLMGTVKIKSSLECSDHERVEFKIQIAKGQTEKGKNNWCNLTNMKLWLQLQ